jgi:hypothetical protein
MRQNKFNQIYRLFSIITVTTSPNSTTPRHQRQKWKKGIHKCPVQLKRQITHCQQFVTFIAFTGHLLIAAPLSLFFYCLLPKGNKNKSNRSIYDKPTICPNQPGIYLCVASGKAGKVI